MVVTMPKAKADWEKVERDYVTGDATYAELAEKYGVSPGTARKHGADGRWTDKRKAYRDKVGTKSIQKSQEKIADSVSDAVVDVMQVSVKVIKRLEKELTNDALQANSLEGVANALGKALRTHELLSGNADSREEHVLSGPSEEVRERGMRELINRILSGEDLR